MAGRCCRVRPEWIRTPGKELVKRLRAKERELAPLLSHTVKVVEEGDSHQANPQPFKPLGKQALQQICRFARVKWQEKSTREVAVIKGPLYTVTSVCFAKTRG